MTARGFGAPSWASIIRKAIKTSLDGVHTCCPGKVVSYSRAMQTATIRPAIKDLPEMPDVPVRCLSGGGGFIHFDLVAGDEGMIQFSEYDFSAWRRSGKAGDPPMLLRHGLYGVFDPGNISTSSTLPVATVSGFSVGTKTGAVIRLGSSVTVQGGIIPIPDAPPATLAAAPLVKLSAFNLYAASLELYLFGTSGGGAIKTTLEELRTSLGTTSLEAE